MKKFFLFFLTQALFIFPHIGGAEEKLAVITPNGGHIQKEEKELLCRDYLPQIGKDLTEMNKPIEGGWLWRHDRRILAFSGRVEAGIQQYMLSCKPEKLDLYTCSELIPHMKNQLKQSENTEKNEMTRSAYAKRARTNAQVFSELCDNTSKIEKSACDIFKEKARNEFAESKRVLKIDEITLHATLSSVYYKIHQLFCRQ
ncbi:MAG: hypothetical protein HY445_02760 [Candidatus Niyogibacteria bacterium]|nr:hypothetical protein [Candidatus Niyogibacteria bacterium]